MKFSSKFPIFKNGVPEVKLEDEIFLHHLKSWFKRFLNPKVGATPPTVTSEGPFVLANTMDSDNNAADTE